MVSGTLLKLKLLLYKGHWLCYKKTSHILRRKKSAQDISNTRHIQNTRRTKTKYEKNEKPNSKKANNSI